MMRLWGDDHLIQNDLPELRLAFSRVLPGADEVERIELQSKGESAAKAEAGMRFLLKQVADLRKKGGG